MIVYIVTTCDTNEGERVRGVYEDKEVAMDLVRNFCASWMLPSLWPAFERAWKQDKLYAMCTFMQESVNDRVWATINEQALIKKTVEKKLTEAG